MKKKIFLVLFLIAYSFAAHAQLYTFRNFNHKDGLPISAISAIQSCNDGSILLGTDGAGLIRFNGYNFTEIELTQNENHHVTSLSEKNGTIYYTSRYKGLYQLKNNRETCLISSKKYRSDWLSVRALKEGVFAATEKSFLYYQSTKTTLLKDFKKPIHISQLIELDGLLIILTNQGNFVFDNDTKKLIPLKNWIKGDFKIGEMAFGFKKGNRIILNNNLLTEWIEIILEKNNKIYSIKAQSKSSVLGPNEKIISSSASNNQTFYLSSLDEIYREKSLTISRLPSNFEQNIHKCHTLISDKNGDAWAISMMHGLYKISNEPFTKILLHPLFESNNIFSIYKTESRDIILSTGDGQTYVGNTSGEKNDFDDYHFKTRCFAETNEFVLLGTDQGLKKFDKKTKKITKNDLGLFKDDIITYLKILDDFLYVGVSRKGLFKYNLLTKKLIELKAKTNSPDHYYTSQYSPILRKHFFGTNDGIFVEDTETGSFTQLIEPEKNGSYRGVSIIDSYGTCWFTGEHGLTGILQNGEIITLNDPSLFNSTLFYTLNSDNYGDLIIGTNKGLTILQVNEQGMVLSKNYYTGSSGFEGYETHMRSQFQDKNAIFVGTIEGLFLIDMDILRNFPKPSPPSISLINSEKVDFQNNSFAFEYHTNNPKIDHLQYTYRIIGYQNEWSDLTEVSKLYLSNLPDGKYVLEVRSTYDGKIYSEIGRTKFQVTLPFWKTRWFIVLLIIFIVLINIFIIQKRKTFEGGNFFRTKDMLVELDFTPTIIMFAFIAVVISNNIGPLIDPEIPSMLGITFVAGFLLLLLYFIAKSVEKKGDKSIFRLLLVVGYIIAVGQYLIGVYISNLNPFYVLPVALAITLSTYIFEQLKHVIIQNLIILIVSSIMTIYMEDTFFNKYLFLFLMLVAGIVSVFTKYLRYDSMERLIFVSGIVNKGNVQVIAFNDEGTITYVSENIKDILPINHDELLHQKISYLNQYLPEQGGYRSMDLTRQFFDGQKYLSPILTSDNNIIWVEWSCKIFSENVRVILGQNVSERKEIENTYELLVENAEDLIYQCDMNGVFQFVNNRTSEVLEYTKEELVGHNSMEYVQENYRQNVLEHYQQHFEKKLASSYHEFPIVSSHGAVRWIGQHVTSLFRSTDKKYINGFLALARDITEKREQRRIIEEQRDDITSSITYAQRIQLNLLPSIYQFEQVFDEHFVVYKPKDIVSGDFYWTQTINDKTIVALADCTGHGVPGAFMTLLGINILNSVVLENRITDPALILNEVDKKLLAALPEKNGVDNINDGMELTICSIDHNNGMLSYACAGSRFLIFSNNSFNLYKGDVKHIGDNQFEDFRGFVSHFVQLEQDSILYLLTDGFQDQFGGVKNKKFSFRRLLELLEANNRLPLQEQKTMIEEEFEKWKLNVEQTDDVTIIGLRGFKSIN